MCERARVPGSMERSCFNMFPPVWGIWLAATVDRWKWSKLDQLVRDAPWRSDLPFVRGWMHHLFFFDCHASVGGSVKPFEISRLGQSTERTKRMAKKKLDRVSSNGISTLAPNRLRRVEI